MSSLNIEMTSFRGLAVVRSESFCDERGCFYRTFCSHEFGAAGLPFTLSQSSISTNFRRFTLRGMHYQVAPHSENKLIRCIAGAIFDVVIDLRPDEPTYGKWFGLELTEDNALALLIPHGMAHGFCTLRDDTSVFYMMDAAYMPGAATGVRWNDPAFGIEWPCAEPILNARDATWPDVVL